MTVIRPEQARSMRSPIGGDATILAGGDQTGGALAAIDVVVPPGEGPPLHIHTREDETAYVLEGELRWKLADEMNSSPAGSFVFIPRGLPHAFHNPTGDPARMLITFSPAGMEGFFEALAEQTTVDLEAFRSAAATHSMEVVGPPLAESDPV
jgi:quercetin dioxygenase-like cupin family protein